MNKKQELVKIIENNPTCTFEIDNDCWIIYNDKKQIIAESNEFYWHDDEWYDNSSNYGAGLAQALIIILNKKGFNIKSYSV